MYISNVVILGSWVRIFSQDPNITALEESECVLPHRNDLVTYWKDSFLNHLTFQKDISQRKRGIIFYETLTVIPPHSGQGVCETFT